MCRVIQVPRYGYKAFAALVAAVVMTGAALVAGSLALQVASGALAVTTAACGLSGLLAKDYHDMSPSNHLR